MIGHHDLAVRTHDDRRKVARGTVNRGGSKNLTLETADLVQIIDLGARRHEELRIGAALPRQPHAARVGRRTGTGCNRDMRRRIRVISKGGDEVKVLAVIGAQEHHHIVLRAGGEIGQKKVAELIVRRLSRLICGGQSIIAVAQHRTRPRHAAVVAARYPDAAAEIGARVVGDCEHLARIVGIRRDRGRSLGCLRARHIADSARHAATFSILDGDPHGVTARRRIGIRAGHDEGTALDVRRRNGADAVASITPLNLRREVPASRAPTTVNVATFPEYSSPACIEKGIGEIFTLGGTTSMMPTVSAAIS